ncbi:MAG: PilZ domain-containing protein [Nitrospirae bacterium]|nr:PilZ domain-containing protein [Nitrospirota bacterium]
MNQSGAQERREGPRYIVSRKLRGKQLPPFGTERRVETPIHGRVENISKRGLCFVTEEAISVSSLLLCEIVSEEIPVAVPTMMRVQWVHKNPEEPQYHIGLQFLL